MTVHFVIVIGDLKISVLLKLNLQKDNGVEQRGRTTFIARPLNDFNPYQAILIVLVYLLCERH